MRKTSSLAIAAALLAASAASVGVAVATTPGASQISERSNASQQHGERGQQMPGDTKASRLGTGYMRRWRAPVGKRNSWSVKQGQRMARNTRNRRASRA